MWIGLRAGSVITLNTQVCSTEFYGTTNAEPYYIKWLVCESQATYWFWAMIKLYLNGGIWIINLEFEKQNLYLWLFSLQTRNHEDKWILNSKDYLETYFEVVFYVRILCGLLSCDSSPICKKCWSCLCIPLHSWWRFGTPNGLWDFFTPFRTLTKSSNYKR